MIRAVYRRDNLSELRDLVIQEVRSLPLSHFVRDSPNINSFTTGKLKPVVDSVFEFKDTLKAYDRLMTNRAKGKVVVRVDPNAE
jgi:hypothetical protein